MCRAGHLFCALDTVIDFRRLRWDVSEDIRECGVQIGEQAETIFLAMSI